METDGILRIKTVCPRNCFDSCGIIAYVKNGKIIKIEGDPEHPITRGHLCAKGYAALHRTYSPLRIKYPMKRVGPRGEKKFVQISWEDALNEISQKLKELHSEYGGEALMEYRYGGNRDIIAPLVAGRFLNLYGATMLGGTFCDASEYAGFIYTYGSLQFVPMEIWSEHTECVVIWGHRPEATHIHMIPFIYRAQERGAKLIVIDPRFSLLAMRSDLYLQPRPGTDGALALGMANYILEKNLEDRDFIERHTFGFEEFKKLVEEWPVERASEVTGVPVEKIKEAAEIIATRDTIIQLGMGLNRYTNSHNAVRAIACLAGLTGNIGKPGACCGFLDKSIHHFLTAKSELILFPEGAKINKKRRLVCITGANEAILAAKDPPIKAVICWRGSFIPQLMNVNKTLKAIEKLDLFVVIEQFMTDAADYADYILPACSDFEQGGLIPPYGHRYLQAMVPVIPPLYESRPDLEIWSELGRRLGFEKYFPEGWTWLDWAKILLPEEILDKIISPNGPWKVPPEIYPEVPYSNGKFPTPSGKLEFWSQKIVDYGKGKEGDWSPLPIYYEPVESPVTNPEISKKYPLIMISTLSPVRTHSQYINLPWMREIEGEPFIEINPEDAKIRGVNNGDLVCVFNDRGKLIVRARVTATIKKGVVNIFNGWWVKDGACPNCLTEVYAGGPRALGKAIFRMDDYSPAGTLDGQSGAYGCCLVEVKKVVQ